MVVLLSEASRATAQRFKQIVPHSLSDKSKALLQDSYRKLKHKPEMLSVITCMRDEKWLPTDMGFCNPRNAVLFDSTWGSLSPMASLPFIDRTSQICVYKDELEELGVAVGIEKVQFHQKH